MSPRSASPTPTASPTSTSRGCCASMRRMGRSPRSPSCAPSCSSGWPSSTARTAACSASARSPAPSTGSMAASSACAPPRSTTSRTTPCSSASPYSGWRPPIAARLSPRGLLGVHGHLQGRHRAQRPVGLRRRAVARDERRLKPCGGGGGQASDRTRRITPHDRPRDRPRSRQRRLRRRRPPRASHGRARRRRDRHARRGQLGVAPGERARPRAGVDR